MWMSWYEKEASTKAEADRWNNHENKLNKLIQLHRLIKASDRTKSQASYIHKLAIKS